MRFFADRAIGHRPGFKAVDDRLDRLDFFDWDGSFGKFEVQQTPQRAQAPGLVIDQAGIIFENLVVVIPTGLPQLINCLRVEQVIPRPRATGIDLLFPGYGH